MNVRELTDVPGVKLARYRGRYHWITIVEVARFPAAYLSELVDASYWRAFASLSRAKRIAIGASHPAGPSDRERKYENAVR